MKTLQARPVQDLSLAGLAIVALVANGKIWRIHLLLHWLALTNRLNPVNARRLCEPSKKVISAYQVGK